MSDERAETLSGRREFGDVLQPATVTSRVLEADRVFPNSRLPVLILRGALRVTVGEAADVVKRLLASNQWSGAWVDGIYPYHHYHSTAHEVLVVIAGSATVQLGGESGLQLDVTAGDALVIPAGVAHKKVRATSDFTVVGAYPPGQDWDMNYGKPAERPQADHKIAEVPLPRTDPLYGSSGPVLEHWNVES